MAVALSTRVSSVWKPSVSVANTVCTLLDTTHCNTVRVLTVNFELSKVADRVQTSGYCHATKFRQVPTKLALLGSASRPFYHWFQPLYRSNSFVSPSSKSRDLLQLDDYELTDTTLDNLHSDEYLTVAVAKDGSGADRLSLMSVNFRPRLMENKTALVSRLGDRLLSWLDSTTHSHHTLGSQLQVNSRLVSEVIHYNLFNSRLTTSAPVGAAGEAAEEAVATMSEKERVRQLSLISEQLSVDFCLK